VSCCFAALRQVRRCVPASTFQSLVQALVISRLDYSNGVVIGLPLYLMWRLQSVLNAAAQLIFGLRRSDNISDALISLHWLRISERIKFKVAVLTYNVLHGRAPSYLGPLTFVADLPSRRNLRSSGTRRLVQPRVHRSPVGSRAFPVASPQLWIILPLEVTSAPSLEIFRRRLKTYLVHTIIPGNILALTLFYCFIALLHLLTV